MLLVVGVQILQSTIDIVIKVGLWLSAMAGQNLMKFPPSKGKKPHMKSEWMCETPNPDILKHFSVLSNPISSCFRSMTAPSDLTALDKISALEEELGRLREMLANIAGE